MSYLVEIYSARADIRSGDLEETAASLEKLDQAGDRLPAVEVVQEELQGCIANVARLGRHDTFRRPRHHLHHKGRQVSLAEYRGFLLHSGEARFVVMIIEDTPPPHRGRTLSLIWLNARMNIFGLF